MEGSSETATSTDKPEDATEEKTQVETGSTPVLQQQHISALVVGGTGAIGRCLVGELVRSPFVSKVTTLGRRKVEIAEQYGGTVAQEEAEKTSKLVQKLVDFDKLEDFTEDFKGHTHFFCALGTTRAQAGSDEAFRLVDLEYVKRAAKLASEAGTSNASLVSSMGANANSWFLYPKTKGQAENALKALPFVHVNIYRPGVLDRGSLARFGEKFGGLFLGKIKVDVVAQAMLAQEISLLQTNDVVPTSDLKAPTVHLFANKDIRALANSLATKQTENSSL